MLIAPPHLSPSSIATFQQCPLKFKFSRIDGLVEPPTEATLRGNFVHSIFESLYGSPSDQRTIEHAREISRQVWEEEYKERASVLLRRDEAALREFRWTSWWCVENLFAMETPSEIELDGIETPLDWFLSGVKIKGFIDRWQRDGDSITIGDYKTGKVPNPRYQENKFFQLLLYGAVLKEQLDLDVKRVELLFVRDGVKLSHDATPADFESVIETVVSVKSEIDARCESGEFETNRSRLCDWCSFKPICPAWSKK